MIIWNDVQIYLIIFVFNFFWIISFMVRSAIIFGRIRQKTPIVSLSWRPGKQFGHKYPTGSKSNSLVVNILSDLYQFCQRTRIGICSSVIRQISLGYYSQAGTLLKRDFEMQLSGQSKEFQGWFFFSRLSLILNWRGVMIHNLEWHIGTFNLNFVQIYCMYAVRWNLGRLSHTNIELATIDSLNSTNVTRRSNCRSLVTFVLFRLSKVANSILVCDWIGVSIAFSGDENSEEDNSTSGGAY